MSFKLNPAFKRKLEELSQPKSVSLLDLMPSDFIRANTSFGDIQEMFDRSGLADVGEEEIKGVLESEAWNAFIRTNTKFASWPEMVKVAAVEEIRNRFRKGGLS